MGGGLCGCSCGCGRGCSCGCDCGRGHRRFFGKQERIEMLERYRGELEKELGGVDEVLKELKQRD